MAKRRIVQSDLDRFFTTKRTAAETDESDSDITNQSKLNHHILCDFEIGQMNANGIVSPLNLEFVLDFHFAGISASQIDVECGEQIASTSNSTLNVHIEGVATRTSDISEEPNYAVDFDIRVGENGK